jgi:hypothetical protein
MGGAGVPVSCCGPPSRPDVPASSVLASELVAGALLLLHPRANIEDAIKTG